MWTSRNTKSLDNTVLTFHQGPTPGDFPRLECNMAQSFSSHLPHSFLINLPIYHKSTPILCALSCFMHFLWSVNLEICGFYSKQKHLLCPVLGETLECECEGSSPTYWPPRAGLINKAEQGSFSELIFNARLQTHVASAQTSVTWWCAIILTSTFMLQQESFLLPS